MARKPALSEEQIQQIQDETIHNMYDKHVLMEKYSISMRTAERMMKKLGLVQTSSSNMEMIQRYLQGERTMDLVEEYGMSQVNFNSLLRYRGIEARRNSYLANWDFFDTINTEEKAYFLGFIYADGNLCRNSLKITIRDYDIDILEKLKDCMNSNHVIRHIDNRGYQPVPMVELIITHRKFPEIFNKHGVIERKTHVIGEIPSTIPHELIRHFIRGYVDGDGSFGTSQDKYFFSVVGTIEFLESIRLFINENTSIEINTKLDNRHPEKDWNIRSLRKGGKDVITLLKWLYEDATVYLDRKYNKYLELIK